jgi:hypothetical protein
MAHRAVVRQFLQEFPGYTVAVKRLHLLPHRRSVGLPPVLRQPVKSRSLAFASNRLPLHVARIVRGAPADGNSVIDPIAGAGPGRQSGRGA